MRRLLKELKELSNSSEKHVSIRLETEDMTRLKAEIQGQPNSPYEEGLFELDITVSPDYPFTPPIIRFATVICHPNIHFETGEICLDILKEKWSPSWTLKTALEAIRMLLIVLV
jgi:ubiquitin-protein ligase